jgi:hypothetical protein
MQGENEKYKYVTNISQKASTDGKIKLMSLQKSIVRIKGVERK